VPVENMQRKERKEKKEREKSVLFIFTYMFSVLISVIINQCKTFTTITA
jgi:uncharacterized ion transporter superfamily protein YfcC